MGSPQTDLLLLAFDKRWALRSTSPPTLLIIPSLLPSLSHLQGFFTLAGSRSSLGG